MKLLLDTHSFLWFIGGDNRLSLTARTLIEDTTNDIFLSVASLAAQFESYRNVRHHH